MRYCTWVEDDRGAQRRSTLLGGGQRNCKQLRTDRSSHSSPSFGAIHRPIPDSPIQPICAYRTRNGVPWHAHQPQTLKPSELTN
ncbi:hypothetical protein DTO166G4_8699 [Paecilomyces variotii]|nr:hypothetical protein DTO032I3_7807 [Paecilomyces variotii]KAJ9209709.1 hypothetical protein DTO166G4_8699 [Paecilomyces variotii]KAJ9228618.1 hypothetical protein DTO166G5_8455 [Paecilomyces variotii]KAJ9235092.1 hypothetical protein DTO169E5_6308 [Paecilomyces variotii]KAJ9250674.1 hypothetical protein DTO207G8_5859 [Paecilomyces variotii]